VEVLYLSNYDCSIVRFIFILYSLLENMNRCDLLFTFDIRSVMSELNVQ